MNITIDIYLIISIVILACLRQAHKFIIFYLFVFLHEMSHIIIAKLLGLKVLQIKFLPFGVNARFRFDDNRLKEFLVAIAGPLFSLLLYFILDEYKVQNMFIFIVNMIPIYPLDGGRILKDSMIYMLGNKTGERYYNVVLKVFVLLLIILNIIFVLFLRKYNFLFASAYIILLAEDEIKKDKIREQIRKIL